MQEAFGTGLFTLIGLVALTKLPAIAHLPSEDLALRSIALPLDRWPANIVAAAIAAAARTITAAAAVVRFTAAAVAAAAAAAAAALGILRRAGNHPDGLALLVGLRDHLA